MDELVVIHGFKVRPWGKTNARSIVFVDFFTDTSMNFDDAWTSSAKNGFYLPSWISYSSSEFVTEPGYNYMKHGHDHTMRYRGLR